MLFRLFILPLLFGSVNGNAFVCTIRMVGLFGIDNCALTNRWTFYEKIFFNCSFCEWYTRWWKKFPHFEISTFRRRNVCGMQVIWLTFNVQRSLIYSFVYYHCWLSSVTSKTLDFIRSLCFSNICKLNRTHTHIHVHIPNQSTNRLPNIPLQF